jgi:membrane-associated phospholipid phosphatase
VTSAKYAAAINEVKALGAAEGSTRTADQTQIGLFWNPPIWAAWNRIAQTAALGHHADLAQTARSFAALNLTFADSVIAFYDGKYALRFWRPVTAIHAADTDGNPDTIADPAWAPLSPTAPDPSYPGAHGTISAAGADVLSSFYGDDERFSVSSPALPGVTRSFSSFAAAVQEAGLSRIYAGVHTRLDHRAGVELGDDVAEFVLSNSLLPANTSLGR